MQKIEPVIATDSREQQPLQFTHYKTEKATLYTGDYSVKGLEKHFTVERKSLADLIGSLTSGRDRFIREMERMRGYSFKRLLVIGSIADIKSHNYRSKATPSSVLGSLWAFEQRYNIPVVFAATPEEGALLIERWAYYALRERIKEAEQIMNYTARVETTNDSHIQEAVHENDIPRDADNEKVDMDLGPMFDEFWSEYPRKIAKPKAREKYFKIIRSGTATHEQLMAGLSMARKSEQWKRDNGQFIPHPLTWLNQGRWDDQPPEKITEQKKDVHPKFGASPEYIELQEQLNRAYPRTAKAS